jgi:hypothetical protein
MEKFGLNIGLIIGHKHCYLSQSCGRAIAQEVIRLLPTAAARVRVQVVKWDSWWTKWHWDRFSPSNSVSLPIPIPPTAPHSSLSIIRGWYNRPISSGRTKWTKKLKKTILIFISSAKQIHQQCLHYVASVSIQVLSTSSFTDEYAIRRYIQSVPGGKVNILGGHNIGHPSRKVHMYIYPIPKGFWDRAISLHTVQTSNTPCPHTSCKVHWCWRWNFRKCITLSNLILFILVRHTS